MGGFSRNCSSLYDGNGARMQSPTPVVCKHPRLQDHTSPLQVLQVASGDFLTQRGLPLPPLLTAHMKAGAASRGPRQVNSSRNHCRPQTSARTPSVCAGEVKPALQTEAALPCCTVTALATREHKSGLIKSKCVAPSGVQPPAPRWRSRLQMPHRGPTASGAGRKRGSAAVV